MISFDDNANSLTDAVIMIVDDEMITIEVIQAFLEEENYHDFVLVDDSTQAVKIIEEKRPDLILLDLMMPEVSGYDILKAARANPRFKYIPIIILTASSDTENKLKALDLGATDFLAKPLEQSELILRVRNNLAAKAYQDQLAFYDSITGLPNRHLFMEDLSRALKMAKRRNEPLALMVAELGNFDKISDTIGLAAGDKILNLTTRRIKAVIEEYDERISGGDDLRMAMTLFHMGRNNFSIVIDRIRGSSEVAPLAKRLIRDIEEPMKIMREDVYLTTSIGIATCPPESDDSAELFRLASSAKDYAKSDDASFIFSSAAIQEKYQKRMRLENRLRKAIENDELTLYYQPKVDIRTGIVRGAEALLRWDTEDGFISPGEIIPLAEESGLIIPLGEWVLSEVCRQLREFQKEGIRSISLAANISAKQFADTDFLSKVERITCSSGIDRRFLTLELTESCLLSNIEEKIRLLHSLRQMGMKLSIDDFGTGYSSLSYLRTLPVDELKIDRSFIMKAAENENDRAIVSTIIFLAKKLNLSTVAEGIEKKEELALLESLECDQYQGFYFSRPVSAKVLRDIYRRSGGIQNLNDN